jgi:hypothetical protein
MGVGGVVDPNRGHLLDLKKYATGDEKQPTPGIQRLRCVVPVFENEHTRGSERLLDISAGLLVVPHW